MAKNTNNFIAQVNLQGSAFAQDENLRKFFSEKGKLEQGNTPNNYVWMFENLVDFNQAINSFAQFVKQKETSANLGVITFIKPKTVVKGKTTEEAYLDWQPVIIDEKFQNFVVSTLESIFNDRDLRKDKSITFQNLVRVSKDFITSVLATKALSRRDMPKLPFQSMFAEAVNMDKDIELNAHRKNPQFAARSNAQSLQNSIVETQEADSETPFASIEISDEVIVPRNIESLATDVAFAGNSLDTLGASSNDDTADFTLSGLDAEENSISPSISMDESQNDEIPSSDVQANSHTQANAYDVFLGKVDDLVSQFKATPKLFENRSTKKPENNLEVLSDSYISDNLERFKFDANIKLIKKSNELLEGSRSEIYKAAREIIETTPSIEEAQESISTNLQIKAHLLATALYADMDREFNKYNDQLGKAKTRLEEEVNHALSEQQIELSQQASEELHRLSLEESQQGQSLSQESLFTSQHSMLMSETSNMRSNERMLMFEMQELTNQLKKIGTDENSNIRSNEQLLVFEMQELTNQLRQLKENSNQNLKNFATSATNIQDSNGNVDFSNTVDNSQPVDDLKSIQDMIKSLRSTTATAGVNVNQQVQVEQPTPVVGEVAEAVQEEAPNREEIQQVQSQVEPEKDLQEANKVIQTPSLENQQSVDSPVIKQTESNEETPEVVQTDTSDSVDRNDAFETALLSLIKQQENQQKGQNAVLQELVSVHQELAKNSAKAPNEKKSSSPWKVAAGSAVASVLLVGGGATAGYFINQKVSSNNSSQTSSSTTQAPVAQPTLPSANPTVGQSISTIIGGQVVQATISKVSDQGVTVSYNNKTYFVPSATTDQTNSASSGTSSSSN